MSEWPLPSMSASELVALGDAVVPQLVATLESDAKFVSRDPSVDLAPYDGYDDHVYYAAVVAAQSLHRMPSAARVALPALLATWEKSRVREIKRACHDAIVELCEHAPEEACRAALDLLVHDPDSEGRYRVMRALPRLGPRGLEAAFALARDSNNSNRAGALWWLGGSDDPRVVPLVHELAQHDPDLSVRGTAVRVLVQRARELALPLLIAGLSRHSKPTTFDDLATFGVAARDTIPKLVELLPEVRQYRVQLANALRRLLPHARPPHLPAARRGIALALDEAVRSHDGPEVAALAAALVATPACADPSAARLLNTLRTHHEIFPLGRAAVHLGAAATLVEVLIILLEDGSEFTRADAATFLGELGDVAVPAIPALEAMMARDIRADSVHGGAWKRAHEAVARLRKL